MVVTLISLGEHWGSVCLFPKSLVTDVTFPALWHHRMHIKTVVWFHMFSA